MRIGPWSLVQRNFARAVALESVLRAGSVEAQPTEGPVTLRGQREM